MWTLGIVGAGVMAEVMLSALIDEGFAPSRITASHRRRDRADALAKRYGVTGTTDNRAAAAADLVLLTVKPQTLPPVLAEIRGALRPDGLVASIVAGAPTSVLQEGLDHRRVVRCMPNLPSRIRQGCTVWYAPADVGPADLERVAGILRAVGTEVRTTDEENLDRATAVSGTGPAIVAHFVKAMLEAANFVGEPRALGLETVLATLAGTIEMIRRSDDHVADLIDEVASPGGTTSRALQALKNGRFSAVVTDAVDAAYQRTKEIKPKISTS